MAADDMTVPDAKPALLDTGEQALGADADKQALGAEAVAAAPAPASPASPALPAAAEAAAAAVGTDETSVRALGGGVVHRICSGQVVTSLSTAVKELVDNAIDAGATRVEVKLRESGRESLEVSDNGRGVPPSDFDSVMRKHFTSKIAAFEDIDGVATLGFRGEALSSLLDLCPAEGGVEMFTRCAMEEVGAKLTFEADGAVKSRTPAARPVGTTVTVRKLFAPLPVRRRQFERTISSQFSKMLLVLQGYAIISSGVRISCTNVDKQNRKKVIFQTPGADADMKRNIASVCGATLAGNLEPVSLSFLDEKGLRDANSSDVAAPQVSDSASSNKNNNSTSDVDANANANADADADADGGEKAVRLEGFVSKFREGIGIASGDRQFWFLNGRPIDFPKGSKLLNSVWRQREMKHKPALFLNWKVPPGEFDINLAPDKREVYLTNESVLLAQLKTKFEEIWRRERSEFAMQTMRQAWQAPASQDSQDSFCGAPDGCASSDLSKAASPPRAVSHESQPAAAQDSDSAAAIAEAGGGGGGDDVSDGDGGGGGEKPIAADGDVLNIENQDGGSGGGGDDDDGGGDDEDGKRPVIAQLIDDDDDDDEGQDGGQDGDGDGEDGRGKSAAAVSRLLGEGGDSDSGEESEAAAVIVAPSPSQKRAAASPWRTPSSRASAPREASDRDASPAAARRQRKAATAGERSSGLKRKGARREASEEASAEPMGPPQRSKKRRRGTPGKYRAMRDVSLARLGERLDALLEARQRRERERNAKSVTPVREAEVVAEAVAEASASVSAGSVMGEGGSEEARVANISGSVADSRVFRKVDFATTEVLGQFNKGFIVGRCGDDLYIFDQHACDEKFRFETLQRTTKIREQPLIRPFPLELSATDAQVVCENLDIFEHNGFRFAKMEEDEAAAAAAAAAAATSPAADGQAADGLAEELSRSSFGEPAASQARLRLVGIPHSFKTQFGAEDVRELASLLRENPPPPKDVRERLGYIPPRLPRTRAMFASRACRSAIMIGDVLTPQTMRQVLTKMVGLEQPWNCPHGRPTMRHLQQLEPLYAQRGEKPDAYMRFT